MDVPCQGEDQEFSLHTKLCLETVIFSQDFFVAFDGGAASARRLLEEGAVRGRRFMFLSLPWEIGRAVDRGLLIPLEGTAGSSPFFLSTQSQRVPIFPHPPLES